MNNTLDVTKFGRSSIYDPVPFNKRHSIGSLFGSPLMANNSLGSQEKATFKGSDSVHFGGGSFSDTNDTFSVRKRLALSLAEPSTHAAHPFSNLDSSCHSNNNNIQNTATSAALSNASANPLTKDSALNTSSSNSSVLESKFQNFGKKSELLNVPSPVIESNKTGARPLSPIYSLMLRTDY